MHSEVMRDLNGKSFDNRVSALRTSLTATMKQMTERAAKMVVTSKNSVLSSHDCQD